MTTTSPQSTDEHLRRWRLILGGDQADGTGCSLSQQDQTLDKALSALYDAPSPDNAQAKPKTRRGGLGASSPNVARWLGDIRSFFPASVVRVMQQDAMERLNLRQMLMEPEMLQAIDPDVHLAADILALKSVMPAKTRETARLVIRKVVADLEHRLAEPLR